MQYEKIVSEVIEEYKKLSIDLLGKGHREREYNYLTILKNSYIRTVRDINTLIPKSADILEIGSYLGVVSVSLKKSGYKVSALDIPEFHKSRSLQNFYKRNDIPYIGINLRKNSLPYESNSFDVVLICEVLEHLNFNPLLILKEINRVLKKDGYIYIGMPNLASWENRLRLLKGISIHNPIDDYFKQLDKNYNMIVGLHWREYTMAETIQLLSNMGFEMVQKYYFIGPIVNKNPIKRMINSFLSKLFPEFLPFQVVVAKKVMEPSYDFWQTKANS